MCLSRSIIAINAFAMALVLQACGFNPIFQREAPARDLLSQIEVAPIPARSGQILRNHLLDMFQRDRARHGDQHYVLHIRLTETPQVVAIRRDDVISRGGYSASASFRLVDRMGRLVMSGAADLGSDFEIANSEHATAMAREGARDRLMQYLAEEIRLQITTQHPATNVPLPALRQ